MVESTESGIEGKEDEDDDVEVLEKDPIREKEKGHGSTGQDILATVAEIHGVNKDFDGALDSKAAEHLMPEVGAVMVTSEDFESFVRDSVGLDDDGGMGQDGSGPEVQEIAQEVNSLEKFVGPVASESVIKGGLVNLGSELDSNVKELGLDSPGVVPDTISPSPNLVIHLGENQGEVGFDLISPNTRVSEAAEWREMGL